MLYRRAPRVSGRSARAGSADVDINILDAKCNGLQSKLAGPAISVFLGPH